MNVTVINNISKFVNKIKSFKNLRNNKDDEIDPILIDEKGNEEIDTSIYLSTDNDETDIETNEKKERKWIAALPSDRASYGASWFWDNRYFKDESPFEWYHSYHAFQSIIHRNVRRNHKILNIGCGNSLLSEDMVDDGYRSIENIDFSRVVIDQMKEKYQNTHPQLTWKLMNVTDMIYDSNIFDCVIDKGTLDSVACSLNSNQLVLAMLHEIERILTPNGVYICISAGFPDERLNLLEKDDYDDEDFFSWNVKVEAMAKSLIDPEEIPDLTDPKNLYFVYICKKKEEIEEKMKNYRLKNQMRIRR